MKRWDWLEGPSASLPLLPPSAPPSLGVLCAPGGSLGPRPAWHGQASATDVSLHAACRLASSQPMVALGQGCPELGGPFCLFLCLRPCWVCWVGLHRLPWFALCTRSQSGGEKWWVGRSADERGASGLLAPCSQWFWELGCPESPAWWQSRVLLVPARREVLRSVAACSLVLLWLQTRGGDSLGNA